MFYVLGIDFKLFKHRNLTRSSKYSIFEYDIGYFINSLSYQYILDNFQFFPYTKILHKIFFADITHIIG